MNYFGTALEPIFVIKQDYRLGGFGMRSELF